MVSAHRIVSSAAATAQYRLCCLHLWECCLHLVENRTEDWGAMHNPYNNIILGARAQHARHAVNDGQHRAITCRKLGSSTEAC